MLPLVPRTYAKLSVAHTVPSNMVQRYDIVYSLQGNSLSLFKHYVAMDAHAEKSVSVLKPQIKMLSLVPGW